MAPVHHRQGFIEVQLVDVCMSFGTKPFAKALHRCLALRKHLLPAQRAMLVKEAGEEMRQHACALPIQIPEATCHCAILLAVDMAHCHPVTILHIARRVPVRIHEPGSAS
jgi:hypothetical protein